MSRLSEADGRREGRLLRLESHLRAQYGLVVACVAVLALTGLPQKFAGECLGHEASSSPTGLADYIHRGVVLLMAVGVAFGFSHVALDFLRKPRRPGSGPT